MVSAACRGCGKCRIPDCALKLKGSCDGCGRCVELCGDGYRSVSGKYFTPEALAERIMSYSPFFGEDGGVTFSGGEPTLQSEFLISTLRLLPIHRTIQTCGHCREEVFKSILSHVELVFFDIKHTDPAMHKRYTGVDNSLILANLRALKASRKPFIARIPLINGVNDSDENLEKAAALLEDAPSLIRVELLPYNSAAGAKYPMVGYSYPYSFSAPERINTDIFANRGIKTRVL